MSDEMIDEMSDEWYNYRNCYERLLYEKQETTFWNYNTATKPLQKNPAELQIVIILSDISYNYISETAKAQVKKKKKKAALTDR